MSDKMDRRNDHRQRRRRGFDDDTYSVPQSRRGGSRTPPASHTDGHELVTDAIVKWFNPEKGFGFVTMTDGTGDAFLHVAVVQAAGRESVLPGTKLRAHIGSGAKGAQVTLILEVDESAATAQAPRQGRPPSRGQSSPVDPTTAVETRGRVKWFNTQKGFGFVETDDGEKDVFVHISVLEQAGIGHLAEGQQVTVRAVQAPKGREAISIALAPFT
jgi:cold shock protein